MRLLNLVTVLVFLGLALPAHAAPAKSGSRTPKTGAKKGNNKKKGKHKGDSNVKIDWVNPMYGSLVYGPKPKSHKKYRKQLKKKKKVAVKKKDLPKRAVDRAGSSAFGVRGGTMLHANNGEPLNDPGVGVVYRYRPWEAVGIQLDGVHHSDHIPFGTRSNTLFAASGLVALYPWNTLSPYTIVGVTGDLRTGKETKGMGGLTGAHFGIGIDLGLGKSLALNAEGRVIGWLNQDPSDVANPTAGQVTGSLIVHF